MKERIARAWGNMSGWAKRLLLYSYFAGMVFFFVAWVLGQGFVEVGIVLGLVGALILEPLLETQEMGNRARDIRTIFRFKFAISIIHAVFICYLLALFRFFMEQNFFAFSYEPFSFGLLFGVFHTVITGVFTKIMDAIRGGRQ